MSLMCHYPVIKYVRAQGQWFSTARKELERQALQNNEQRVYIYEKSRNAKVDSFNVGVYGPRTFCNF